MGYNCGSCTFWILVEARVRKVLLGCHDGGLSGLPVAFRPGEALSDARNGILGALLLRAITRLRLSTAGRVLPRFCRCCRLDGVEDMVGYPRVPYRPSRPDLNELVCDRTDQVPVMGDENYRAGEIGRASCRERV